MSPEIAVHAADEPLRSLLRESCPLTRVTTPEKAPWAALACRIERSGGDWDLELRLPGEGGETPLVCLPGEVLEREKGRIGSLIEALLREVARRQEASISKWVERLARERTTDRMFSEFTAGAREASGAAGISLLLPDPFGENFLVVSGDEGVRPGVEAPTDGDAPGTETIPLEWDGDVVGFVRLEWDEPEEKGRARLMQFLERATPILQSVRELSRERELALRDDLTRAYNRRYFDTALEEEIERSRRFAMSLSLIFLDLDELKAVNSRWGHLTGSRVLQEVARRILGAVRAIDRVVRFGGDEFCIVLPQTDAAQASVVASRVRAAISDTPIRFPDTEDLRITASFGIASYPQHASSRDELIRAADEAMYRVKSDCKNAISIASRPAGSVSSGTARGSRPDHPLQ